MYVDLIMKMGTLTFVILFGLAGAAMTAVSFFRPAHSIQAVLFLAVTLVLLLADKRKTDLRLKR